MQWTGLTMKGYIDMFGLMEASSCEKLHINLRGYSSLLEICYVKENEKIKYSQIKTRLLAGIHVIIVNPLHDKDTF